MSWIDWLEVADFPSEGVVGCWLLVIGFEGIETESGAEEVLFFLPREKRFKAMI